MPQTAKPHGTETRKKPGMIGFRVDEVERAEIEAAAEASGLTLGSYCRDTLLLKAKTKATRKPSLDLVLLGKLLAQLGKVGANLNQIAKRMNEGKATQYEKLFNVIKELHVLKESILGALRREDDPKG